MNTIHPLSRAHHYQWRLYSFLLWIERHHLGLSYLIEFVVFAQVSDNLLHDASSNIETLIFCSQTLRHCRCNGILKSCLLKHFFHYVIH
ncbi:hypothetical protein L1987_54449 [Smallanthus sonchifolius]|uniref:Uncharacterized protein n=1 Tax=Smallanthus sonchifolius TaxID=185202 RepID=A0ACB9E880_9ASTR|nr:hypothetical protein L1987_54449 [Smallanthus sonchifolius]